MPEGIVVALMVIGGGLALVLVVLLAARSRVRTQDQRVWGPIERDFGIQDRHAWIHVVDKMDRTAGQAAVSTQAFFLVVGPRVIGVRWHDLSDFAFNDEGFTVRINHGQSSKKPVFLFGFGHAENTLNRLFLDAFATQYGASR